MKKAIRALFVLFMLLLSVFACSCRAETPDISGMDIPDISGMDEATAKNLLASLGLPAKCEYEYSDDVAEGNIIKTDPYAYSRVSKGTSVTIYVSKGKKFYYLTKSVGWLSNINGIDKFSYGDNEEEKTKGFYKPYVEEGYLYIEMFLCCKSQYDLAFYGDFGTASITDTFDKTVPITILYDNKTVDNTGKKTNFTAKIPLSDLDVKKPTNLYIKFDFTVNKKRETFEAGFDLSW